LAHARAAQLLERHGVLTREAVLAEGVPGGFAGIYPVLRAMEERGHVRRGWFVAGLGAAQFALPGAVDRLRSFRESGPQRPSEPGSPAPAPDVIVLAATDPAQPFGAALAWPATASPAKPSRTVGAHVVLCDGEALAVLERGGRTLATFAGAGSPEGLSLVAGALASLVRSGRYRSLELARIDGESARESPLAEALRRAGFADSYRGLVLRHRPPQARAAPPGH
jgi:ATP-dependent Lhr-like helicase